MFDSLVPWFRIEELSSGNVSQIGILVSCFGIAELSLGSVSQLGALRQDRRAGFK